jgi:hypothetical protein
MKADALGTAKNPLVLRGKSISEDVNGLICLDDIWELSGAKDTRAPKQWRRTRAASDLIEALQLKVTTAHLNGGEAEKPVIRAGRGQGAKGTFAHPIIAAAYAGYLSPKLEIEVREIWLRYRAGDATLADEVLQRASAEANHWAGVRALARSGRKAFTDTLKAHGVVERGYMECTEAVYLTLLGGKSYQLRDKMGLPKKANLRDKLDSGSLAFITAAEALSAERIEEENRQGNRACVEASSIGANAIRTAIETDRRSRQPRLLG